MPPSNLLLFSIGFEHGVSDDPLLLSLHSTHILYPMLQSRELPNTLAEIHKRNLETRRKALEEHDRRERQKAFGVGKKTILQKLKERFSK
jgi:hypothetical protein